MDVSNDTNVTNDNKLLPLVQTNQHAQHNKRVAHKKYGPFNKGMHERITYVVLGLFVLLVLYGGYMQNYWLVGVLCAPVIIRGVYKIFDRYL